VVRRGFWMLVGAGLGMWAVLKAQEAASRLTPGGAVEAAQRRARHLRNDIGAALAEGRRAKRDTEAELRQAARSRPAIDVTARSELLPGNHGEDLQIRR
jgi:hypothetical protein